MILFGVSVAACSAGGGPLSGTPSAPAAPSGQAGVLPSGQSASASSSSVHSPNSKGPADGTGSISILNVAGSPLKDVSEAGDDAPAPATVFGKCLRGIKVFVPDRKGDPNSSELQVFYEPACVRLARDSVRIFTPTGSTSETVALTVKNYGPHGAPLSLRTTNATIGNATFDAHGFPIAADGYDREAASTLSTPLHSPAMLADSELIVSPQVNDTGAFCSDAAGYSVNGVKALNATFGWQGGFLSGGTRTANPDGSVTWNGTHTATVEQAPIGGLSIVVGTPNAACPITTPAYTLAGGTVKRTSSSAVAVTLRNGILLALSITHVSVNGIFTIDATTNTKLWFTNPKFITGTISANGTTRATFSVNAFGDGSLTVVKTGTTYPVIDWIVVL